MDSRRWSRARSASTVCLRPSAISPTRTSTSRSWWSRDGHDDDYSHDDRHLPVREDTTLTLGEPRNITVSPDGRRSSSRSRGGNDPVNCLWVLDVEPALDGPPVTGDERLVADPRGLLAGDEGDLPPEERPARAGP